MMIPLCVPFERKDDARRAGARWNGEQRVWHCEPELLSTAAYARLRPFVPYMYRPDRKPPFIRPWMVPQTLWGRNLRALLTKEQWDVVRREVYARAGKRCRVCGGVGPEWPVEADEAWEYDDATLTQTLKDVVALCPNCHHVRHWGKSLVDGREDEARAWMMQINGWTRQTADEAVEAAFEQWHRRSRHQWKSDYTWVTRVHGFQVDQDGERRAETANRELVRRARQAAEELEGRLIPRGNVATPKTVPDRGPVPTTTSLFARLKSIIR